MKTIYSILEKTSKLFPDKFALQFKDRRYTYQQIKEKSDLVKSCLIENTDLQDSICLMMENSDNWLFTYFGILGAGCICNPLDLKASEENIFKQVDFLKPKLVIVSQRFYHKALRIGLDKISNILIIEDILKVTSLKEGSLEKQDQERDLTDAKYSTVMFTSGTTGSQKAIRVENEVVYQATNNIVEYLKIRYCDIYYAILPFSHSFGLGNVHVTFKQGGTVIIADNTINLKKVLQEISNYRASFFCATPYTLKLITNNFLTDFIKAGDSLRIICTNTGPMDPEVTKTIITNLKKTLFFTYYGLTEASRSTFHCFNLYPEKLGSVGKPAPNVKINILDDQDAPVNQGEVGEILIKGNHVVSGYYGDEELNKKIFTDGWMRTGDMGKLDVDGFLYVLGRFDDLITLAGERVSLSEIDKVIQQLNFVADVGCIDIGTDPDKKILAQVVLGEEVPAQIDPETEILAHCRKSLEIFKVPKKIRIVDSVPRTDSGKLKRKELRPNGN